MSPQADYVVANGTGAAVRSDINGQLAAIVSNNSGASAPATTYAYQFWADTSTNLLKLRNGANSAWITVGDLTAANLGLASLASPTFTGTVTIPTLTVSTGANIPLGTAASPTLYFTGDTNTGLYSPGADQLALTTGGTGRLFITSAGSVGIGSSTPGSPLHVTGSGTIAQFLNTQNSTGEGIGIGAGTNIGRITSNGAACNLVFEINGTERARLDTSGRFGIGATPSYKLHVDNGTTTDAAYLGNGYGGLVFGCNSSGERIINTNASGPIVFQRGGTETARIDGSSRLLVGTSSTSTNSKVVIEGSSTSATGPAIVYLQRGQAAASISSGDTLGIIDFTDNAGNLYAQIYSQTDAAGGSSDYPGRLVFSTTADGASSPTERMRIDNAGVAMFNRTSYRSGVGSNCKFQVTGANGADWTADFSKATSTVANCYGIIIYYEAASPNGAGNEFLSCQDSVGPRLSVRSNGGIANYSANNANLSDRNAKKDITPAAGTWNCIKEWEIVNYRYKEQPDDADLNLGVIAQQVAESCPEVITVFEEAKDDQPEKLGIKEQQMYWMAIKALQEAQVRIEQLESKVAALESA